jgi:hypothetical protein
MTVLTMEAIDHEIASRNEELAELSALMIALDDHPGFEHVRRYSPSGVTAERWTGIERSLAQLWEDLGRAMAMLESAQSVRARRSTPTESECAELTSLLLERPGGLGDIVSRMRATHPVVAEFFDDVDAIDALIAQRLGPTQKQLDEAGAATPRDFAELLAISAVDPLSLSPRIVEDRIAAIADRVQREAAELAELAALQANWSDALASTALRLDALRDATRLALRVRRRAEETVLAGTMPAHTDAEPDLRARLQDLAAQPANEPDAMALRSLRQHVEAALRVVDEHERLAQGLLDRRGELEGRLTVYRAKAARLGLGEDPDLLASGRIAAGLLSRRPCDTRAVTRAVKDFQQLIVEKQGKAT